jgi:hypothetical protein
MLSAIVVNHQTGLPGESFLPGGTENLTEEECKTRFEELRDEVFQYQGWDELLREQGLEPITPTPDSLDNEALALAEYTFRHGSRPESSEHMGLKQYIARHPELLGLPKGLTGTEEYEFPSGDRCDVVFDVHSAASAVVEVKADIARGELVKGVYQAVKYRALLEAQRGRGGPHQVKAFLVALSVPDEISGFARRLSVIAHRVDRDELSRFDQTPTGQ